MCVLAATVLQKHCVYLCKRQHSADLCKCNADLAYVGFFCIAAGVELGTGVNIADVKAWPGFTDATVLLKLGPTIAATLALLLTMRYVGTRCLS